MKNKNKFFVLLGGESLSIIGSGLTAFALSVFLFEETGSSTNYALTILFAILPGVLIRPLGGVAADRYNRRLILILSNLGASLGTLYIAVMFWTGQINAGHIYLGVTINSLCNGFQNSAYQAAVTDLIPADYYDKASGMVQASLAGEFIVAPLLAGILINIVGIEGIFIIDFATFFCAFGPLLFMRFPKAQNEGLEKNKNHFLKEFKEGIQYLKEKQGLSIVFIIISISNFFRGMFIALIGPMILAFSTSEVLGIGKAISAIGMLLGSVYVSVKGVPVKYMKALFLFLGIFGISYAFVGLQANVIMIIIFSFLFFLAMPFVNTIADTVIRKKVSKNIQGRIFSISQMFIQIAAAVAILLAGPLADNVFNPLLLAGGDLASSVGTVIGTGPGRGTGLLFIIMGGVLLLFSIIAYSFTGIRHIDRILPDIKSTREVEDQAV